MVANNRYVELISAGFDMMAVPYRRLKTAPYSAANLTETTNA